MHIEITHEYDNAYKLFLKTYMSIVKLRIGDWLDKTMPNVKYKCIIFNNRVELRFTHPSHYTEFALRYTNHEFRIVQ